MTGDFKNPDEICWKTRQAIARRKFYIQRCQQQVKPEHTKEKQKKQEKQV